MLCLGMWDGAPLEFSLLTFKNRLLKVQICTGVHSCMSLEKERGGKKQCFCACYICVCAYVCVCMLRRLMNVNARLCLCIFCHAACLQVTLLARGAAASQQWEVTEERIPLSFAARLGWLCETQSSPVTESLFLGRWARNRTHILHTLSM